ncbi:MAG TPA: phosphoenolpyruvate synthase, partial [Methanocella sp.]|nr:phosphoenolpyruvate synthase [Methanocella sp.]
MPLIGVTWREPVKNVEYFNEIDKARLPDVGGKGANLGELTKAGFPVPAGFCITTQAYRSFISTSVEMPGLFNLLDRVSPDDLEQIRALGHRIREHLKALPIPEAVRSDIVEAWRRTGEGKAYAVRSSATAEDLPTASFAGQQDTYLNISGEGPLLRGVQSCWASLFTDRAIAYRAKNGFGHRSVQLSVVIQQMIFPEVSGIMFTADPVTGRRKTITIDASFGLGEALVSGLVSADLYQVRSGTITKKQISTKKIAIYASPDGGTVKHSLPPEKQEAQALPDDRIIELATIGGRIEAHYGGLEQDIEWCLSDGKFYVVQSRPITSLYPTPRVSDGRLHVFISFGYLQMMTDAIRPLGISFWKTLQGAQADRTDSGIMREAGGRLYIDPTSALALKPARKALSQVLSYALNEPIATALSRLAERGDFQRPPGSRGQQIPLHTIVITVRIILSILCTVVLNLLIKNPEKGRIDIVSRADRLVTGYEQEVIKAAGPDRTRVIRDGTGKRLIILLPKLVPYVMTPVLSSMLIQKIMGRQDDHQVSNLIGRLNQSLPGSITTELGMAVGDLAEVARGYPAVADYLARAKDETFYKDLQRIDGGPQFLSELERFNGKFGARCSGEIDITRQRWSESPTLITPLLLSHIHSSAPGEHRKKYKEGEAKAEEAIGQILDLAKKGPSGIVRAKILSRLIRVYRNYMGLREYPKHVVMRYLGTCKRCLLEDAKALAAKGALQNEQDIYYLSLSELLDLEEGRFSDDIQGLIEDRKKRYEQDGKLSPPPVMTSEGEVITGKRPDTRIPKGALTGTPVSAGSVEGVARVILRLEEANLNQGEILVAPYTDPGWTPLFGPARGLVTEVGGMMTHGSVVAREYGIPAVVGV